jgi:hypothetical protein
MKKVIKVSIPEPCHEDWSKMSQTEKGAFCQVCTKEVIDFTNVIDEDIVKHVLKNDNACGRFSKTQLDRNLTLERSSGQRLAPLAASLLLPLTMMAGATTTSKQGEIKSSNYTSLGIGSLHKEANRIQITVTGTITDLYGEPMHKVRVEVKETGETTYTDKKGNYNITFLDKETLIFTIEGHEVSQQTFGNYNETFNTKMIAVIHAPMIMGKVIAPDVIIEEEILLGDIITIEENTIIIKGTVTEDSLPLPGANIIVKGTRISTQTDFDGNYTIEAPKNAVLTVEHIGFNAEEVQLSNIDNVIDIDLLGADYILGGAIHYTIIDEKESFYPFGNFGKTKIYTEREAEKAARKKAEANGLAFKKLKAAREKEARQLKRASKNK